MEAFSINSAFPVLPATSRGVPERIRRGRVTDKRLATNGLSNVATPDSHGVDFFVQVVPHPNR